MRRDPAPFLPLTPAAFHVLLALADGPKHGYAILKDVEERTGGDVRLSTGTLYGLIKRFLDDELIVELAPAPDDDERRRPYKLDRKSTRLNSSHLVISYAVFCLKIKH